jgi:hypothetical protein
MDSKNIVISSIAAGSIAMGALWLLKSKVVSTVDEKFYTLYVAHQTEIQFMIVMSHAKLAQLRKLEAFEK